MEYLSNSPYYPPQNYPVHYIPHYYHQDLRQHQQQQNQVHYPQYDDYHEQHTCAHHQTGEYLDNDHDETFASGVAAGNAPLNLGILSDHDSGRAPQHTIDTQAESGVYDHSACNQDADPDLATLISADVQGFLNGGVDDEDEE